MKFHRIALSVVALTFAPWAAHAQTLKPVDTTLLGTTDRMIVKYRHATVNASLSAQSLKIAQISGNRRGLQLSLVRRTTSGSDVMRLSRVVTIEQARALAADLRQSDASIEYAEPDRVLVPTAVASDPMYAQQWDYFDAVGGINVPGAWDKSTGKNIVVAVLDTGVRSHVDLKANLLAGYDFIVDTKVSNDGNGRDADATDPGDATTKGFCYANSPASNSSWHGTHVAGTIGAVANNGAGVAGVAHGAKVLPVRVLGRCGGYTSDIADGLIWAAGGTVVGVPANPNPARVINLSLGGSGACDTTMQNAINQARSRGSVVVVAAGNSNADAAQFTPASCAGVITVAATGKSGGKASYSNHGSKVTLAAPGGDGANGILSTLNAGVSAPGADNYVNYMGTSMATPHVAGVAALMLSVKPTLTPDNVASLLKSTVRAFPAACSGCGAGIVNAQAAVHAALGTTAVSPAPTPAPAPAPAPVATAMKEVEANNSIATAQNMAGLPMTVTGTMGAASDLDFYKFSLPGLTKVVITLKPNASSNYDLALYTGTGAQLAYSRMGTGVSEVIHLQNGGSTAVTLYLRVNRTAGLSGTQGTYTLSVVK